MTKALTFYLSYFQQKRRLEEVWASYLIQGKGSVSISLFHKTITLKYYSLKGLSSKEDIADHINQAFPYFKVDICIVKLDKIVFKTSRLPQNFFIPKNYKKQKCIIPIGCDEDKKIIQINTNIFVSLGLFCFSGSGKTTFLKNLINYSKDKSFFGFRTVIIDAKNDGDFDEFSNHCQIIKTIEECHQFLTNLHEEITHNTNQATLIVFEEFHQFADKSKFQANKEKSKMAQEIASLLETGLQIYRSKKVHFILTTQNMNLTASPIDLSNVQLKIFSYVSKAQANTHGIPLIYANREDLRHGKFIFYKQGQCSLMRGLSYER